MVILMNFYRNKKNFQIVVDEFLKFIDGKKLVIHNAKFDISHINNELMMVNRNKINFENVIDTLEISKNKFPGSQISLDASV